MTTPKEALERIIQIYERNAGRQNEKLADIPLVARRALASLEGDAVERVARIIDPTSYQKYDDAYASGDWHVQMLFISAVEVARTKARAILATGLVPDEAEIRGDWHTTGWDRARNSGRILLVWREFAGVREHVELGRYSDSKTAWVNTYGHPFHAEPDGWAPLLPFKTAETIRADEREKCAKVAENFRPDAGVGLFRNALVRPSDIAAAIRSNRREA